MLRLHFRVLTLRFVNSVEPVVGIRRLRRRKLREEVKRLINQRILANVPKSPSQILRFRHDWKPALPRTEIRSAPLTVRRRPDERRQGPLHQIAFNSSDSDQRVRHRRSPSVEAIRWVRSRRLRRMAFVETTPERTRMRGRRAHAGPLLVALPLHYLTPTATSQNGERPIRRDGSIEWKPHRRRRRRRRTLKIDASGRRRSTEKRSGISGGKSRSRRRKGRRRRRRRRRIGGIESPRRGERPQNRPARLSRRNRHCSTSGERKSEREKTNEGGEERVFVFLITRV